MKAIAWDDEPSKYMDMLKDYFTRYHIDLEIFDDPDKFIHEFTQRQDEWTFVVLDYLNEKPKEDGVEVTGKETATGGALAREIAARASIPIFIVTGHLERAAVDADDFPPKVFLKTKHTSPAWMAGDIVDLLRQDGLYSDERRVFLVYGHDKQSPGATDKVHLYLSDDLGLEVIRVDTTNLLGAISDGLVDKMRDCRAVVSICTPDDQWASSKFQPRLNVVLEMGIAMGLGGGVEKLCVLKHEGIEKLPSDLDGVMYIPFSEDVSGCFANLRKRLAQIGVKIK